MTLCRRIRIDKSGPLLAIVVAVLLAAPPFAASWAAGLAMETTRQMIREKFPDVPQISTAELSDWLEDRHLESPLLLDVRASGEYEISHLAGAHRAADAQSALAALQGAPKDRAVVLYCSVGYRSSKLARALMEEGYENVQNLEGSLFQWANEGRPVYRGEQRVHEVHPYNWLWGRLLAPELRSQR